MICCDQKMKNKIKFVSICSYWIIALSILFTMSSCNRYILFRKSEAPAMNAVDLNGLMELVRERLR